MSHGPASTTLDAQTPTLASTQSVPTKVHVFFAEPLEKRILLSGNVMAAFLGGSLFINGDELDNDLDLQIVENDIVLVGNQRTTINGSSDVLIVATDSTVIPEKLVAELNVENGRFEIGPGISIEKSRIVFAGDGGDSISVDGTTIASRLVIIGSSGATTAWLFETAKPHKCSKSSSR